MIIHNVWHMVGMKECSDSLPFVLGGKHRPPATPKKTFAPLHIIGALERNEFISVGNGRMVRGSWFHFPNNKDEKNVGGSGKKYRCKAWLITLTLLKPYFFFFSFALSSPSSFFFRLAFRMRYGILTFFRIMCKFSYFLQQCRVAKAMSRLPGHSYKKELSPHLTPPHPSYPSLPINVLPPHLGWVYACRPYG